MLVSTDATAVAALNRAQVELVQAPAAVTGEAEARPARPSAAILALGASAKEQLLFERWLKEL